MGLTYRLNHHVAYYIEFLVGKLVLRSRHASSDMSNDHNLIHVYVMRNEKAKCACEEYSLYIGYPVKLPNKDVGRTFTKMPFAKPERIGSRAHDLFGQFFIEIGAGLYVTLEIACDVGSFYGDTSEDFGDSTPS